MYTILDYINYYKDKSLDEIKWNVMDDLILSILIYIPVKSFKGTKSIKEFYEYSRALEPTNCFIAGEAVSLLEKIKDIKRYEYLTISNFEKIITDEIQFGATTFRIKNKTIISYEGTNGSFIGWLENFRLCYTYPTNTQSMAINYLKNNVTFKDKNIDVVGHSKGGNLAMASVMEINNSIFKKIDKIYNFDGPGFLTNEYKSDKFNKMHSKLVNFIPYNSAVGVLLNNRDYNVIKSNSIEFKSHNPFTWCIFGEMFINDKICKGSKKLNKVMVDSLDEIDPNMLKETIEVLIDNLEKDNKGKFSINFNDLMTLIKNRNNIDPSIRDYLLKIIDTLMEALNSREEK